MTVTTFGNINFIHGDCMDYMRTLPDKAFSLAIIDAPYGIGDKLVNGGTWAVKYQEKGAKWDIPPDKFYFQELFRVSQHWIIWGANHLSNLLPASRRAIVWHKPNMDGMHTMSNCEIAYSSFDANARCVSISRPIENRIHVCQKPIALYTWLLQNYAKPGDTILDTHLGSGSSAIAAYRLGFAFTGIELDKDYYDASVERFRKELLQTSWLIPSGDKEDDKPVQQGLFHG